MDYNWPLFDGAHVLIQPKGMSSEQLQEGYYYFLREAYSLTGIMRRFRGGAFDVGRAISHFMRNYLVSRYGMLKVSHAIRRKSVAPVGHRNDLAAPVPAVTGSAPAAAGPVQITPQAAPRSGPIPTAD
jgi:hypothetical protein